MRTLDFQGDVVVVTGASRGIGRACARELAAHGAAVVVNGSSPAVHEVVEEIVSGGGTAVASQRDVRNGHLVVSDAIERFGDLHALVLNAGIVRDRTFLQMSRDEWNEVLEVDLDGVYAVAAAGWPYLMKQHRGRLVITTSSAALHGNVGQANYASAKAALLGFTATLAREGQSRDVLVNAVAPVAVTSMNRELFPEHVAGRLAPEQVAPVVSAMCHREWSWTGQVVETGGGWVSRLRWQRSPGVRFGEGGLTPAAVLSRWDEVSAFPTDSPIPTSVRDSVLGALGKPLPGEPATSEARGSGRSHG